MDGVRKRFDFEKHERLPENQEIEAAGFLNRTFPVEANAREALQFVENGGAKCQFAHDKEYFYFRKYIRPGHGLMALVSTIEWKVIIYTDDQGAIVNRIEVGRGATGF